MAPTTNPWALALFLAVVVLGSCWVIRHGTSIKQQKNQAEASALYVPPLDMPMAQSPLPQPFAFEAKPQTLHWRRLAGHATPYPPAAYAYTPLLCFWASFSPEDYAQLQTPWALGEKGRPLGIFVDGFLPPWFLEGLCKQHLLCPGKEKGVALKASEVFLNPHGQPLLYALPRLNALFGCTEEG